MIHKIILSLPKSSKSKKALFLDRDGVINKNPPEHNYVKSWKEFKFNKEIFDILKYALDNGFIIIVVTNQRGIATGLLKDNDFLEITNKMNQELKFKNLKIHAVYYCPHNYSDQCTCRKPKIGLIKEAVKDFNIDLSVSVMIGDLEEDILAARAAKVGKMMKINSDFRETDVSKLDKLLTAQI